MIFILCLMSFGRTERSDKGDKFFKGFVFGGIIGAIAGVLLAPKSGREMRDELGEEAEKLYKRKSLIEFIQIKSEAKKNG